MDLSAVVHRKKQRVFTEKFAEKVYGGTDIETAKIEAVRESYPHFNGKTKPKRSIASALRKANELLENKPWIQKGLEIQFTTLGFSPEDAARQLIELINCPDSMTEAEYRAAMMRHKALKAYYDLTIPKRPVELQIRPPTLMGFLNRTGPPPIAARAIPMDEESEDT